MITAVGRERTHRALASVRGAFCVPLPADLQIDYREGQGVASLTTNWLSTRTTPLTERTALSIRSFKSEDFTEPTIVTLPFSTSVLMSSFESAASDARTFSIWD